MSNDTDRKIDEKKSLESQVFESKPGQNQKFNFILIIIICAVFLSVFGLVFVKNNKKVTNSNVISYFNEDDIYVLENLFNENEVEKCFKLIIDRLKDSSNNLKKEIVLNLQNWKQNEKEYALNLVSYEAYKQTSSKASYLLYNFIYELKQNKLLNLKNKPE